MTIASSVISTKTGCLAGVCQAGVLRKYLVVFFSPWFTLFENIPQLRNQRRRKKKKIQCFAVPSLIMYQTVSKAIKKC